MKFWAVKKKGNRGQLDLYGIISSTSWYGDEVTATQFKADLDNLGDIEALDVFINSDGGDVFAGQAIHSMLKRHKAYVTVYIDGVAASIASVIAMAGDKVVMPRNALMMIHNPSTAVRGNAADFRKMADTLDNLRESLVAAYQDKTGLDRDELIAAMDAETWISAEEAVRKGFADEIEASKSIAACINEQGGLTINGLPVDLNKYHNAPQIVAQKATPKRSLFYFEQICKTNERGETQ